MKKLMVFILLFSSTFTFSKNIDFKLTKHNKFIVRAHEFDVRNMIVKVYCDYKYFSDYVKPVLLEARKKTEFTYELATNQDFAFKTYARGLNPIKKCYLELSFSGVYYAEETDREKGLLIYTHRRQKPQIVFDPEVGIVKPLKDFFSKSILVQNPYNVKWPYLISKRIINVIPSASSFKAEHNRINAIKCEFDRFKKLESLFGFLARDIYNVEDLKVMLPVMIKMLSYNSYKKGSLHKVRVLKAQIAILFSMEKLIGTEDLSTARKALEDLMELHYEYAHDRVTGELEDTIYELAEKLLNEIE